MKKECETLPNTFKVGRDYLTESCRKVLLALSKMKPSKPNKSVNKYQIHKKTHELNNGVSKSRVHNCIEKLEGLEFVEGEEAGTTRAGHTKKEYKLNTKGLIALWKYLPKSFLKNSETIELTKKTGTTYFPGAEEKIKLLRTASENHNLLREKIFGKWNFFEEKGVEDIATKSICKTFSDAPNPFFARYQGGEACIAKYDDEGEVEEMKEVELEEGTFIKASTTTCEQAKENIVLSFYLYPLTWLSSTEEKKKWRNVIVDDDEVREIMKKFCERKRKKLNSFIEFLKDMEMVMKGERKSSLDKVPFEPLEEEVKAILNQFSSGLAGVGSKSAQELFG